MHVAQKVPVDVTVGQAVVIVLRVVTAVVLDWGHGFL